MDADKNEIFTEDQKDILQEIMNIAFGNATADLSEIIDIYVILSVPDIKTISAENLDSYINNLIDLKKNTKIIEQKFFGEYNGSGLLVFPDINDDEISTILDHSDDINSNDSSEQVPVNEILIEIGNILIGACIGKITSLLNTYVTYSPPDIFPSDTSNKVCLSYHTDKDKTGLVMKTTFTFNEKNIEGFLLLLTNDESFDWLKKALGKFMESYL